MMGVDSIVEHAAPVVLAATPRRDPHDGFVRTTYERVTHDVVWDGQSAPVPCYNDIEAHRVAEANKRAGHKNVQVIPRSVGR